MSAADYVETLQATKVRLEQLRDYIAQADALAAKHFKLMSDALSAGRIYKQAQSELWRHLQMIQDNSIGKIEYFSSNPIAREQGYAIKIIAQDLGLPWDEKLLENVSMGR